MLQDNGGSVWESNPPILLKVGQTGFEVRRRHQPTCTPHQGLSYVLSNGN